MDNKLLPKSNADKSLSSKDDQMMKVGFAANQAAQNFRFADYKLRRAPETLRRQKAGLALFQEFLAIVGVIPEEPLFDSPVGWQYVTWGLVDGFVKWQLKEGYAIHSINIRLSTVKTYAKLAMQSGVISTETYAIIATLHGYAQKEGIRVDQKRPITRVGFKKEENIFITFDQSQQLKQPMTDSQQGRRDALMMCILLDHGLRVGELVNLQLIAIDSESKILKFYRPKVQKIQRHYLSPDTYEAYQQCRLHEDWNNNFEAPLIRRSNKNKLLLDTPMSTRGVTHRVNQLGKVVGIQGLSAHDCRHYWATTAAQNGTDPFVLQEAGGWSSLAMPRRYIQENEISNEGILLSPPHQD